MKKHFLCVVPALLLALFAASCSSMKSGPKPVVPLGKKQLEAMAARAKQPQLFGIVVYPSDAGPLFGGVMRTHEGEVASLSFPSFESSRAPVVPVGRGGSTRFNALLDTSAQQSWASLDMMNGLGIELLAAPSLLASRPTHVFDTYGGILGVVGHLKIGDDMSLENVLLNVRGASGPLGPLARGLDRSNVEVVLGMDFIKTFNHATFDFRGRYAVLSASLDCKLNETNLLASVPLLLTNGALGVAGVIDGVATTIILDTGGDYAVAQAGDKPAGRVQQVSIGDLVMRDLQGATGMDLALGPIKEPRLGRLALARFKMTLDFRSRMVHFERP